MHKIALVLAIAAVAEGAVTLHLVRQLQLERENGQTLQARVTQLEQAAPQRQAGATFVAVPQPTVSPFTVGAQTGQARTGPAKPAPAAASGTFMVNTFAAGAVAPPFDRAQMREQMNASMERQRALLRDPEYREAMIAQQKLNLTRSNPTVAKDLDLTPEQVERLFGTLAEQALRMTETSDAVIWDEQSSSDPAKLQAAQRKATEQYNANEAELRTALGETKYREWQEYQSTAPARWQSTQLRTSLANAGVPLDPTLAKPLLKVFQEQQKLEQQRLQQQVATQANAKGASQGFITSASSVNVVGLMTNSVESLAQTQRRQREALARVLTPEQLKVVEDEQNGDLQMQRLQQRMMEAQQAAGSFEQVQGADGVTYVEPGVTVALPVSD
jgi:hypothetical protein